METLRKYDNEQTDCVNVYESSIIQISTDQNNNFEFLLDWLEGDYARLLFESTSKIVFDLKRNPIYGNNFSGKLEIRGFSYKQDEGSYTVKFDFDTDFLGTICFKCKNFSFYVPSAPISNGGNDYLL